MANVIFRTGTKAQFDALAVKDGHTLYWLHDVQELWKGDALYAKGTEATTMASGLMSAEDKKKLDALTAVSGGIVIEPADKSVSIVDSEDGVSKLVAVQISKIDGNALTLREDGLFVSAITVGEGAAEVFDTMEYEVVSKPEGTLVDYREKEIRIMCPEDTEWSLQEVGANGDASTYYIGFRAYAPDDSVVSFKEDMKEKIEDETMHSFEGNEFAGIDEHGRKYSVVWLATAKYDEENDAWTYYGANSSEQKYIGWNYSVEWYDADGVRVGADSIRINLSNEECHFNPKPYYAAGYAPAEELNGVKESVSVLEEKLTWGDI